MVTFFPETREWLYENMWQMMWVNNQHLPGVTEAACQQSAASIINGLNDLDMLANARWMAEQLKGATK